MATKLVVVESPAKAKTINKYLGSDYKVIASFGHVRDLPPKDGSVRPDESFAMDWAIGDRASRAINEITSSTKQAQEVFLATDPDREGEAIAWHVLEVLKDKGVLDGKQVHRVTFNEITKQAVKDAMANPRRLDQPLIDAYMARRALDYLVGFRLSPVLWRKLPGSRSAGRVQSVALRLICQRESEIEKFKAQEFWTIEAIFKTGGGQTFPARLTQLKGQKLDKFALKTESDAAAAVALINTLSFDVGTIERKQARRNPAPPFTTSTLQQEASRKLGFSATRTMRTAQNLYEGAEIGGEAVGLITYMRTDGVDLSGEAVIAIREMIGRDYGDKYLPDEARIYKNKAKNAQEAHEAIRPTDINRKPDDVAQYLDSDQLRLYTLIWQRTAACQMTPAVLDQVAIDIQGDGGKATFRANGSVMVFDGYQRVYQEVEEEDPTEDSEESKSTRLPAMKEGEKLDRNEVKPDQHFTQPPPRYTEASLVKKLEELGIGRPSTYASIMQVLQDRNYVVLDKRRFTPEDRGRIVTAFLENFFGHYVEYDFTADLEEKLDDISAGNVDWKQVLNDFWTGFSAAIDGTKDLKVSDVLDVLDEALGPHFFPVQEDGSNPRLCTACGNGRLGLKLGKFGAFIGCSNYPTCKNTRPLAVIESGENGKPHLEGPKELGQDPATKLPVSVRVGPYGPYVQLGPEKTVVAPEPVLEKTEEPEDGKKKKKKKKKADTGPKPKRVSLLKDMDPNMVDLQTALKLLGLPREIGKHPEDGEMILAGVGRFGPYLKMGSRYKSLPADDSVLEVGLNRAVVLLAEPSKGGNQRQSSPAKNLGNHPGDSKAVTQHTGRYGPYVKHGKMMATITKAYDPDSLTLEQALEILAAKAAKNAGGDGGEKPKKPAKTKAVGKPKKTKAAKE
ncbi:MAG: type I DNA topoisomerase [Alphaproteobacteria bacterium]|nr:type I DNA topoisomerase [Alphaproteobacteria bacterium]